jgi:hypothetical protein
VGSSWELGGEGGYPSRVLMKEKADKGSKMYARPAGVLFSITWSRELIFDVSTMRETSQHGV